MAGNLDRGNWSCTFSFGFTFFSNHSYRRRSENEVPKQTRYNIPLEILYTIVPLVIVFGLFYFTARDQGPLIKLTGQQQHTVNVVGFRWSWTFNYKEAGVYDIGTPANPPMLYLPVDEKVKFELTSPDVIHSFWVPDFMIQMQNIPGVTNQLEFTANELGEFRGFCNILCGRQHSQMRFTVKVVTPSEYDAYIQSLKVGANA